MPLSDQEIVFWLCQFGNRTIIDWLKEQREKAKRLLEADIADFPGLLLHVQLWLLCDDL